MRIRMATAALITIALLSNADLRAQSRAAIDLARLGPQVGERVPDFMLRDQTGAARTLESVMGARGAMLVFIRSADW